MYFAEESWLQQHQGLDRRIELSDPKVRFSGHASPDFEACMEWYADLVMTGDKWEPDGELPEFSVGYLRCTAVDLTRGESAPEVLDALSADLEVFCPAFDGNDVTEEIQDQFEAPLFGVLALEVAEIASPFRGRGLGVWLAAEVIARLAPYPGTLVLGYPQHFGPPFPGVSSAAAVRKLRRHWRRVGLEPLRGAPQLLGQSTDRRCFDRARARARSVVKGLSFTVDPKAA